MEFSFKSENMTLDMQNVASGYKQFGMIQLLLKNKQLTENSLLIIDEPEVNLHPSLQIKLAEIIVLLSKNMNINIYVNSHSPFIIEALEVFSLKEDIIENISFYLCDELEKNQFNINYVKTDEVKKIYESLTNPYYDINDIRFEYEWENDLI